MLNIYVLAAGANAKAEDDDEWCYHYCDILGCGKSDSADTFFTFLL
jgi:hypothetical protein